MNISGLNPSTLSQLPSLERAGSATGAGKADGSFGSVVRDSLESMEQTQKAAEQEVARAVTGESPDLHRTIIALQTADLNFQLGLQVRNKVIGAYEEIMRMQV
ncbi:MAG: flagellar hook-basal body complex protein FliE [Acidobacteriota bacterium]|nr:flagellar hook-basal body complex protein FliE [Acidobacteriota bacterium]